MVSGCSRPDTGDKMRKILVNAVKCKGCGDIIESKHRHDYVTCSCGMVSVDGGHEYLRRCAYFLEDIIEMSVYEGDAEND